MADEDQTIEVDLRDVEAELCRLPDVLAARIVADRRRPPGRGPRPRGHGQAREADRPRHPVGRARIVRGRARPTDRLGRPARTRRIRGRSSSNGATRHPRSRIVSLETQTPRRRASPIRVILATGDDEAVGFAEGSIAARRLAHGSSQPRHSTRCDSSSRRPSVLDVDAAQQLRIGDNRGRRRHARLRGSPEEHRVVGLGDRPHAASTTPWSGRCSTRRTAAFSSLRRARIPTTAERRASIQARWAPPPQLSSRSGSAVPTASPSRRASGSGRSSELGFRVRRVAGEFDDGLRPDDVWLPFLAIDPADGARARSRRPRGGARRRRPRGRREPLLAPDQPGRVARSPPTSSTSTTGGCVFHHHDLPWQRAGPAAPSRHPAAPRATRCTSPSTTTRGVQLENRGLRGASRSATRSISIPQPRRPRTRRVTRSASRPDDVVLLQPARAIPRKNVPAADRVRRPSSRTRGNRTVSGSGSPVRRKTATTTCSIASSPTAPCPVTVGRGASARDAYAAADLVVFPSTWEGFGNPVIESIAQRPDRRRRTTPCSTSSAAFGVQLLSVDDARRRSQAWLARPDPAVLEAQRRPRAPALLDLADLPRASTAAFAAVGWERVVSARADPVVARRARIARWVALAKRVGYAAPAAGRSWRSSWRPSSDFPSWVVDADRRRARRGMRRAAGARSSSATGSAPPSARTAKRRPAAGGEPPAARQ